MYGQPGYGQPPAYGGQPGYGAPMQPVVEPVYMPQQQAGPTVIQINNDDNDGTPCQFCGTNTNHICRRKVGCVAIAWGICLLWTTGILCCLPCCMDGCKDV